ncbi:MAG: hypothetical protein IJG00_01560 [Clostridia bacterium]|nr:hypothetical protein [Clostridia bacterium]
MKVLKKAGLALGLFSLILGGALHQNSVFAAPDKEDFPVYYKSFPVPNNIVNTKDPELFNSLITKNPKICNFAKQLNEKQFNAFKNSFETYGVFRNPYDEGNLFIWIKSINYLVSAVQTGDLEFVKLVVENFDIPNINQTDDCGCGSPLKCAVCLANNKDVDSQTAKDIVDYLLSCGADPYYEGVKSYIPDLFKNISPSSPRMIFKEIFQKHGYYDII